MWWCYIINSFKPWRLSCPGDLGGQGAATKATDNISKIIPYLVVYSLKLPLKDVSLFIWIIATLKPYYHLMIL